MDQESSYEAALGTVNDSLMFLLLFVLALLLSLAALLRQRESIRALLRGEDGGNIPSPYPLQHAAGAINVGGLGFFFVLTLKGWQEARQGSSAMGEALARMNLWASLLVLGAAVVRLLALDAAWSSQAEGVLSPDRDLPA